MHLIVFSDDALRMLITIELVATAYGVSRTPMMKVANVLTRAG